MLGATACDVWPELATAEDGVRREDQVVVYDSSGITSACRVYWTFKVRGGTCSEPFRHAVCACPS